MSRTQSNHGRRIGLRRSPIHGRGVFALKRIGKGERIIEYTGERISHDEVDRRYPEDSSPHTMLFTVDKNIVIDATRIGNTARWINHSCNPNCESVDEEGRIYIEAIRNIGRGEELTYDYNLVLEERHTPAAKLENPCFCGEQRCRGTLLGRKRR
jgi:SET domain-containing protein